jgi:subtilisin family serine protease
MSGVLAHTQEPAEEEPPEEPPAWSLPAGAEAAIRLQNPLPQRIDREWAFGGATGRGVRVAVLDSGIEFGHPAVGALAGAVAISVDENGDAIAEADSEGDLCGHGTACAGIIRALAPDAEIYSVRVLGANYFGSGKVLLAGLRWAVQQGYDVINMSLSTTKKQLGDILREIADSAYFRKSVLVAAAHNMPVESFPWRFSSVISVGSHEQDDPLVYYANPDPPVEFFGRGVDVEVAWMGGSTIRATGNSFAAPCISAIAALILSKHPGLTPFQLKTVLHLTSNNVIPTDG